MAGQQGEANVVERTAHRLAQWCYDFAEHSISPVSDARARAVLLDSLGCALYASVDEKAQPVLQTLRRLAGNTDCTIIGSQMRASLPVASFVNGALIRTLD